MENFGNLVSFHGFKCHPEGMTVLSILIAPFEHEMDYRLQFVHVQLFFFIFLFFSFRSCRRCSSIKFSTTLGNILPNRRIDQPFHIRLILLFGTQDIKILIATFQCQTQRLAGFLEMEKDAGGECCGRLTGVCIKYNWCGGVSMIGHVGIVIVFFILVGGANRTALGDALQIGQGFGYLVPQCVHYR